MISRILFFLGLLGAAGDKAIRLAARPASANEGSFDGKVMATIAVDAASSAPAAILLAAIAEGVGKLFPPSLDRYGLTTRDRLSQKANNPVWELAMRIAKIFGGELDLFIHDGPEPVIAIEPLARMRRRSRMRSRNAVRASSGNDIAYAGAGPCPPRNGCQ